MIHRHPVIFFVAATIVYAGALVVPQAMDSHLIPPLNDTLMGQIVLMMFGNPKHHIYLSFLSWSLELKLALGPGFLIGVLVGFFRVNTFPGIFQGLLPGLMLALVLTPTIFVREGILLLYVMSPVILATSVPYSLVGALVGWRTAKLVQHARLRVGQDDSGKNRAP